MVDQHTDKKGSAFLYSGLMPQEEMLEIGKMSKKLFIGIPKENNELENRVSLTPEAVEVLVENGHEVIIEAHAGSGAKYTDLRYSEHGATIVDSKKQVLQSDIILKVAPLEDDEIEMLKGNQLVMSSLLVNQQKKEYIRKLMSKKVTAIAYELIMNEYGGYPILRSMDAIAGNAAIMIAGELLSNCGGGKGIILGGISGITPTEIIVIGAGNAGEYAVRAALGLGAFVKVFDTSVYRLEQLQKNIGQRLHTSIFHPQVLKRKLKSTDVIIGAMAYQNTNYRYFVTEEMVKDMKNGSVIIDLSIDQGGCIETSECKSIKSPTYIKHGVLHYSIPNIPSRYSRTASIALSNVLTPTLIDIGNSGGIKAFLKDKSGVRKGTYIYNGILTNEFVGHKFNIPSKNIELLMAAF